MRMECYGALWKNHRVLCLIGPVTESIPRNRYNRRDG